jgi:hypothetical protein
VWRRVDVVDWTDVSEDRIASIFRVEKSTSEEPAWAGSSHLHGATPQKTAFFIVTAVKTSNPTYIPRVGFELTISVFERAKTVHALDCASTVMGSLPQIDWENLVFMRFLIVITQFLVTIAASCRALRPCEDLNYIACRQRTSSLLLRCIVPILWVQIVFYARIWNVI